MKGVAIITGPDTYLDHLGVLAYILDIPVLVSEESTFAAAKKFYPQINVEKKTLQELSPDFLATHFDAVFHSGRFFTKELKPLFDLMYKKKIRFVFCPHGNSDKGRSFTSHPEQDISFVYGKHMLCLLRETNADKASKALISTGNYRLPFYQKYRSFYDTLALKELGPYLDLNKKTVLYAPSWEDGENPSSFFTNTKKIIKQLSSYNILIKLHPFLEKFHPAKTYQIMELFKNRKGVHFLTHFPSIYPLLYLSDLYLGDYSSIGYDYLVTNKPLYFLREQSKEKDPIENAGLIIPAKENVCQFIEKTLERNIKEKAIERKKVYSYAFGEDVSLEMIQEKLTEDLRKVDPQIFK